MWPFVRSPSLFWAHLGARVREYVLPGYLTRRASMLSARMAQTQQKRSYSVTSPSAERKKVHDYSTYYTHTKKSSMGHRSNRPAGRPAGGHHMLVTMDSRPPAPTPEHYVWPAEAAVRAGSLTPTTDVWDRSEAGPCRQSCGRSQSAVQLRAGLGMPAADLRITSCACNCARARRLFLPTSSCMPQFKGTSPKCPSKCGATRAPRSCYRPTWRVAVGCLWDIYRARQRGL